MGEVKEVTLPLKKGGEVHCGHVATDFYGVVWGSDSYKGPTVITGASLCHVTVKSGEAKKTRMK